MEVKIAVPEHQLPVDRAWVVTMTIKSFKGRKNVDIHLFRAGYDAETEGLDPKYDWNVLIGDPMHPEMDLDPLKTRLTVFESFTIEERDQLIQYIKDRYDERVSSIIAGPLDLPIPLGLPPLSSIPEGKTMGFIRFEKIPNYTLPFVVHGFYDLSQHQPLQS